MREGEGEEMAPRVLLDPAGLEHRLAQGTLHLALTPQRELAVVHKAGGLPLAPGVLMGAIQVAARRARELETWLDMCVREDWVLKKVEVRFNECADNITVALRNEIERKLYYMVYTVQPH